MKATLAALVVFCCLATPVATLAQSEDEPRRIAVTGRGEVDRAPDLATVTVGVTTEAETAADALAENSVATRAMLEQLTAAGIAGEDMQTSGLSLSPRWTNRPVDETGRPEIAGYVAQNTVTVRVRDLPVLGDVLDDVVSGGANTFNGLQFGLAEPEAALDEARRAAVADALRKAELYAAAAGVDLGPILSISESNGTQPPRPVALRDFAAAESVPIAEGEVSLSAGVSIVFAIDDPDAIIE